MASIIQIRRDTASDWTSANPTLAQGELGLETDTSKLKAGDGTTAWTSLGYYTLATVGFLATSTIGSTVQGYDADTSKTDVAETRSASINMADQIVQRPVLKDYGEVKVAMAAHAVDLELGNVFTYTLSGGQTLTFSNPPASGTAGSFTMIVTNGGSATLTWPSSVDWPAATAPTLTASGVDILAFMTCDGGTTWYGFLAGAGMG